MNLSASSCGNFNACSIRYRNANVYGIRKIKDTDAQRQGLNWHKLHTFNGDMDAITKFINKQYEIVPEGKSREEWITERTILLYSMAGYNWYYSQQEQFEVIASELKFKFPLIEGVTAKGFIDEIVRDKHVNLYTRERKSTSRKLDDEAYWNRLNLDIQINLYLLGANDLLSQGKIPGHSPGINGPITGILYDVWHKPAIRPKFLTQKDSKDFVESGMYCGTEFEIKPISELNILIGYTINGEKAIINPGKKEGTFAIYETPEMFGARLLQDITENPHAHFQQRELSRTTPQMRNFCNEIENIAKMMQYQTENKLWYPDNNSCESPFKCEYRDLCYNGVEINLGGEPPEGFEFIFKKGE